MAGGASRPGHLQSCLQWFRLSSSRAEQFASAFSHMFMCMFFLGIDRLQAACSRSGRMFFSLHVCCTHFVFTRCSAVDLQATARTRSILFHRAMPSLTVELVKECSSMLSGAEDGERLVKTVHEVLSLLERHGHVYSMKLKPSFVGVSPLNRDGSGINPVDVHDLLGDIVNAGWLDSRVTAIGVEPSCEQELLWNHDFFKHAENMLGTMDTSQIKALSLAGSHTNAVLRCFAQELPHEGDEMVTHKGKLNLELLRKRDPDFFRAVQDGVLWRVLSKDVAQQLPQLLSLVQRMGNATLQRGEHEVQLMRRLHGMWLSRSHGGGHVDFMEIKRRALTGKSIHTKALPHLYSFALKHCGGRAPFLLDETETFVRLHSPSTRSLGEHLWAGLAADAKGANQVPRFRHALVTCMHDHMFRLRL